MKVTVKLVSFKGMCIYEDEKFFENIYLYYLYHSSSIMKAKLCFNIFQRIFFQFVQSTATHETTISASRCLGKIDE